MFRWLNTYRAYVNLNHRADRNEHMIQELQRVGLHMERFEAIKTSDRNWDLEKVGLMWHRSPGAIGCLHSQVEIMKTAFAKHKSAWVNEDDLVFSSDILVRLNYIQNFLNRTDWDIFWCGGTFHKEPVWHDSPHTNREIIGKCNCALNKDWEATDDEKIVRTYGCWSTYSYIVNFNSIEKILALIENNIHLTIGIDHLFIMLQPLLYTYAFIPGSVKQIDNISDIGRGVTMFSNFKTLGEYWFQDKMDDFNYNNFYGK